MELPTIAGEEPDVNSAVYDAPDPEMVDLIGQLGGPVRRGACTEGRGRLEFPDVDPNEEMTVFESRCRELGAVVVECGMSLGDDDQVV